MNKLSIKFLATVFILIVSLATMLIFGAFSYDNTKDALERRYFKEADVVLQNTTLALSGLFRHTEQTLLQLARSPIVIHYANAPHSTERSQTAALDQLLELARHAVSQSRSVKFSLSSGHARSSPRLDMPSDYDPRNRNWYRTAVRQPGQVVWSEPYLDYLSQVVTITAATTVVSPDGALIGVLSFDFDVSSISGDISKIEIGDQGFVMLLNRNGTVIANRNNFMIGERPFSNWPDRMSALDNKSYARSKIKGQMFYLKANSLDRNGMTVVTAVSQDEIIHNLFRVQMPILVSGLLCLLFFAAVTYLAVLKAIRPLLSLANHMKSAEQGNYAVRLPSQPYREVNQLARGFNHMLNGIQKRDEEIQRLAYYDSLTGLLNRRSLKQALADAIDSPTAEIAVVYVDIDNFKTINDTNGHTAGDRVLAEIAGRILGLNDERIVAGRIGGDEFVLMVRQFKDQTTLRTILEGLLDKLKQPVAMEGDHFRISASIGVALYPEHGSMSEELLQKADMAMYKAKQSGKNTYRLFDEGIQLQLNERLQLENELKAAMAEQAFTLFYQPIYLLSEGRITNIESLLRCNREALRKVPILKLIHIAEETGLIVELEKWVLHEACTFIRKVNARIAVPLKVSVNISAVHIKHPQFVDHVREALARTGAKPEWLELEITETAMMDSFETGKDKLEALKAMNIHFHLDDFGSGYSSLNYLQKLPIDYVKIDKTFVQSMLDTEKDNQIAQTIVELAHRLGKKVVAEGVEEQAQFDKLLANQCDYLQGYYISKPMPSDALMALLEQDE